MFSIFTFLQFGLMQVDLQGINPTCQLERGLMPREKCIVGDGWERKLTGSDWI